jgi:hypothetical protein
MVGAGAYFRRARTEFRPIGDRDPPNSRVPRSYVLAVRAARTVTNEEIDP